jgi:hypothetical protein
MDAQARYDAIVDDLVARNDDCELSQMMGMPCVKRSGKMVAGFSKGVGEMVFKLPDETARREALGLGGAHLFDPGGNGRPFKEWVAVPSAQASTWERLAHAAVTHPAA